MREFIVGSFFLYNSNTWVCETMHHTGAAVSKHRLPELQPRVMGVFLLVFVWRLTVDFDGPCLTELFVQSSDWG